MTLEDPEQRRSLPEYEDVPAAATTELTAALEDDEDHAAWMRSLGNSASSRFSSLNSINRTNVSKLEVAWIYHSKDGKANIQSNPVIANGVMYAPTAGDCIVAINAANGEEIWRFKPGARPAMRGLVYWPGNTVLGPRLFFTAGNDLFALDPKSGTPVEGFGKHGRVASGGLVAPVIFQDIIVVANWNVIESFEIATGKRLWEFRVLPKPSDPEEEDQGGNCWGGMSLDAKRGIVYVSTGSPHPNFIGVDHAGENAHANSVIALEAKTGRVMWSFQEIRHDIWDLDIPAPPNLVTVLHDGKRVDAVAQVTKIGNTLLLDRVTGKPLFPYRMKRAPVSKLPGERTWPYQPVFERPEPFARQVFDPAYITDISPEAHEFVAKQVENANYGWFQPFEPGKPTVYFDVHGGAQWTGAAFEPTTGRLYVSANELPWIMTVVRARVGAHRDPKLGPTAGEQAYKQNCAVCHGVDRKGKGMAPPLIGLTNRMLDDELLSILKDGRNSMPPIAISTSARQELFDFLFDRDIPPDSATVGGEAQFEYVTKGYPKLLDDQGYPGSKPPWGTLNAIDLKTGKIVWKTPLGEYGELTKRGIPKTGTENFGGAIVTAGGLVFCAGTRDLKIRAFDSSTGSELWSYKLPFGGFAIPSTYQVNGRQYVVIAATGGGKLGGAVGDAYVAFALPQSVSRVEPLHLWARAGLRNEAPRTKASDRH
ncbi:MAG TPA: PQQ-binding-like beta-propeller repeat protein [Bryobacteraceae bacterium]|nr:PQQ-binding-like beta-propeller repeat protein [Bryobacteraceae bacterium]